jgi:drug/metabolite transporter (DMT)-like permease
MQTLLFGLATATVWAFADIFIAKSTNVIKPIFAAALVSLLGASVFGIYYLLFIRHAIPIEVAGIVWSALAGLFIAFASAFFFKALNKGPIGIVSALSSTYPAVTLILAISIFGATISMTQAVGFGMVIIGVVAAAGFHAGGNQDKAKSQESGTGFALLAAVSWGIGYGLLAEGVKLLGWEVASVVQFGVLAICCLLFIAIMWKPYAINSKVFKEAIKSPFILGAALTQQAGAILLNIGLSGDTTGGSIIVALSACYPVLTTIMAYFYFKERIPYLALAGGLLAIIGIVTLSL